MVAAHRHLAGIRIPNPSLQPTTLKHRRRVLVLVEVQVLSNHVIDQERVVRQHWGGGGLGRRAGKRRLGARFKHGVRWLCTGVRGGAGTPACHAHPPRTLDSMAQNTSARTLARRRSMLPRASIISRRAGGTSVCSERVRTPQRWGRSERGCQDTQLHMWRGGCTHVRAGAAPTVLQLGKGGHVRPGMGEG